MLLLLPLSVLLGFPGLFACFETEPDRLQKGLQVYQQILLGDAGVPVQQEEELPLHQIDLGHGKPEAIEALDGGIPSPMLVLGAGVIQILGCQNEGGQEDPVNGATHALGHGGRRARRRPK